MLQANEFAEQKRGMFLSWQYVVQLQPEMEEV
jgi:hypothetical protein